MSTALAAAPALVTLDALRAAAAILGGVAVRTPLLPADDLFPPTAGGRVWLKPEMLQRGGAFKLRGAYTFLAELSPESRARGVVAPSSGNHAQAVALAARLFGDPGDRRHADDRHSREARRAPSGWARASCSRARRRRSAWTAREEIVAETGGVLVPPYDHPTIIAGQGTRGLEIDRGPAQRPAGARARRRWRIERRRRDGGEAALARHARRRRGAGRRAEALACACGRPPGQHRTDAGTRRRTARASRWAPRPSRTIRRTSTTS